MKITARLMTNLTVVLGFLSFAGFIAGYYVFEILRPKMIRFEILTQAEEGMVNIFGIGLLFFLAFCLLSFFQILRALRYSNKISLLHVFILASSTISFLLIFGDIALLSDIGNQYNAHLSQPEWTILYIVMAFQIVSILLIGYANLFVLSKISKVRAITKDSNIFLVAQYIGAICGLLGLFFIVLNFFYTRPLWMLRVQTIPTTFFLLIPYFLTISYWFAVKCQEKAKGLYDEKQILDIHRSSLFTLVSSIASLGVLYLLNIYALDGPLCVLWFPFYLFLIVFLFSSSNLYFSKR